MHVISMSCKRHKGRGRRRRGGGEAGTSNTCSTGFTTCFYFPFYTQVRKTSQRIICVYCVCFVLACRHDPMLAWLSAYLLVPFVCPRPLPLSLTPSLCLSPFLPFSVFVCFCYSICLSIQAHWQNSRQTLCSGGF